MSIAAGRLFGVGVGPGDPDLVTVKAARLIGVADVVAYHCAAHGRSVARSIAERYMRPGQIEEALTYPVTTESTDHPSGYAGALDEFYEVCASRLASHLDAARDVVLLCEGDPFFYGSYAHMHARLAHRYATHVVPGVTSVSAASAALGSPLVAHDERLVVLPGTLPGAELEAALSSCDAAAILKLGRTFPTVRAAIDAAGKLESAWYVERTTTDRERIVPLADVDPDDVPYCSLAIVTAPTAPIDVVATAEEHRPSGEVAVVGLGPAGPQWLTPEARDALADAQDLVGYSTYLRRVHARPGQRVHASDNTEELDRAALALSLAREGRRVAVVSSGDPGVFAMAAALIEVASAPEWNDVPVRILPGVTAAQAAASRVGAPLGHDYCVLSLSDRLKPWVVIERRLAAAAAADMAIAIYNPASSKRTWQVDAARDVILRHRKPDTPVVSARDVGGPNEVVRVTTLADLDSEDVDMRTILLVGSSQTTVVTREDGTSMVWTSREYPA